MSKRLLAVMMVCLLVAVIGMAGVLSGCEKKAPPPADKSDVEKATPEATTPPPPPPPAAAPAPAPEPAPAPAEPAPAPAPAEPAPAPAPAEAPAAPAPAAQ